MNKMSEYIKKCKLNEEELKIFLDSRKNMNPTTDHSTALRTMTNPLRREILKFIGYEIKTSEEIKNNFDLDESQLNFQLSMLSQTFFILGSDNNWKLTPRGIGFLENAQLLD